MVVKCRWCGSVIAIGDWYWFNAPDNYCEPCWKTMPREPLDGGGGGMQCSWYPRPGSPA